MQFSNLQKCSSRHIQPVDCTFDCPVTGRYAGSIRTGSNMVTIRGLSSALTFDPTPDVHFSVSQEYPHSCGLLLKEYVICLSTLPSEIEDLIRK